MTQIKVSRGTYTGYDVPLLSGGQYDLGGNQLIGIGLMQGSTTTNQIDDTTGGWDYKVGSSDQHDFIYNSASKLTIGTDITFKDHILFDANDTYDIGTLSIATRFIFNESGVAIIEGYTTGNRPGFTTDTGILFCVPTAGGKTELRCGFQSGASQILATEP